MTSVLDAPPTPAPTGSLKPVIDVIPAEAYENPHLEGPGLPRPRTPSSTPLLVWGLILVTNPLGILALEVVMALAVSGLFIIAHDAAHGALFRASASTVDRPPGHAPVVARVRGLGAGPQPHPPRLHRAPGLRLRVAPVHARAVRRHGAPGQPPPPPRVVVAGRRRLLPPRGVVAQDDRRRSSGPLGQDHPSTASWCWASSWWPARLLVRSGGSQSGSVPAPPGWSPRCWSSRSWPSRS